MNVTVTFGSFFPVMLYSGVMLMTGWAIGAHWGHTLTAGWALLAAAILLYLHDAAVATLFGIAVAQVASDGNDDGKRQ